MQPQDGLPVLLNVMMWASSVPPGVMLAWRCYQTMGVVVAEPGAEASYWN